MSTILLFAWCLWSIQSGAPAPQLPTPTKTAVAPTPEQMTTLRAAVALEQQGKVDEAIDRFTQVLADSPDNVTAMYEMALAYNAKNDYGKSLDLGLKAAEYKAGDLALIYALIGTNLDQQGKPQQAVEIYKQGAALVPDPSTLYYNLAITYLGSLKDEDAGRDALKKAALANPNHVNSQYQLARLFQAGGYRTPALLAWSRFLILEPGTARTGPALNAWLQVLRAGVAPKEGGGLTISVNPNPKTDEGDFQKLDMVIGISRTAQLAQVADGKSEIASIVAQIDQLFAVFGAEDPGADRATFVWSYYVPYFVELQKQHFTEPFVYFLFQRTTLPGVREWMTANRATVQAFLQWSAKYSWPK